MDVDLFTAIMYPGAWKARTLAGPPAKPKRRAGVDPLPVGWRLVGEDKIETTQHDPEPFAGMDCGGRSIMLRHDGGRFLDSTFWIDPRFAKNNGIWVSVGQPITRWSVERCSFDGGATGQMLVPIQEHGGADVSGGTVTDCRFTRCGSDAITCVGGHMRIERCYFGMGGYKNAGAHYDALSIWTKKGPVVIRDCWFDATPGMDYNGATSWFAIYNADKGVDVEGCCGTGKAFWYSIYSTSMVNKDVRFRNCGLDFKNLAIYPTKIYGIAEFSNVRNVDPMRLGELIPAPALTA